jgi:antitoxin (DNA-binding transcriptional repressor) of toxin-antitoxin stability system
MDHMDQVSRKSESSIGVTAFKARCLSIVEDVASGRKSRVVLTKRGKAVAIIVPAKPKKKGSRDPWGGLRGSGFIPEGVDITEPTGEVWSAEIE